VHRARQRQCVGIEYRKPNREEPERRSDGRQRESRHVRIVACEAVGENPEISRSRDFIDAVSAPETYVRSCPPERRKR
jgi:hypothetical protein